VKIWLGLKNLSKYKINKLQHGKCFVRYLRTRCFCIKKRHLPWAAKMLVVLLIRSRFKFQLCLVFPIVFFLHLHVNCCSTELWWKKNAQWHTSTKRKRKSRMSLLKYLRVLPKFSPIIFPFSFLSAS